jgi:hypothetical protein
MHMAFFIVFDTCTHASYYGDVHQVLALPEGAVIRYEYKRSLFKADAGSAVDDLARDPSSLPVPALLMYGEKRGFVQGSPAPDTMLTRSDSLFVPTRSANLVAVAVDHGPLPAEDVLYLHLQLRGFVRPDLPGIGELIEALEGANSLPFGDRGKQCTWISLLPASMVAKDHQLTTDDQTAWPTVVDSFVTLPTQFKDDVFWRVRGLSEEKSGAPTREISLVDRPTNLRVHSNRWRRDYPLNESKRYSVTIQTCSPQEHGHNVPAGSTIAMTSSDDDQGLLKLAADPLPIVPNQIDSKRFSISTDSALDTRFTGIHLETQVPGHTSSYPPGSECSLTFSIRKVRWRFGLGIGLSLAGTAVVGYEAGAKPGGWLSAGLAAGALLLVGIGGWLLSQQFKLGK